MKKPLTYLAVLLCLASAGAPLRGQSEDGTAPRSTATGEERALLQPGDVVRLRIWREPDLSGEYTVDEDGVVVFPLLGPRAVRAESPISLRDSLIAAYRGYLRNPSVEVTFLRRVTILGAVRQPGLYPVDPTMTVADAIALAGGITAEGKRTTVQVMRDGRRLDAEIDRQAAIADTPIRSGDQLFVPERSWISRNTPIVATMISAAVSLLIAFAHR